MLLKILRKIINTIISINRYLGQNRIGNYNGFLIIFIGMFIIATIGMIIFEIFNNDFLIKLSAFLIGAYVYILLPFAIISQVSCKKYIFFGKKILIKDVIKTFTIPSYIIFIIAFSLGVSYPILGIPILFNIFEINFVANFLLENLEIVIYNIILVTSFLWFLFHIIYETVNLQEIRIKVSLFIAIVTTSTFILGDRIKNNSLSLFAGIILSYIWVQYIIELKAKE